jgi:hypothetical protein
MIFRQLQNDGSFQNAADLFKTHELKVVFDNQNFQLFVLMVPSENIQNDH